MLKKPEEMELQLREQMRGGKGIVIVTHLFKPGEMKGKARLFCKITLNPGCTIGTHPHDFDEEIFYMLKGQLLVNDNGVKRMFLPGEAMLTTDGDIHGVENVTAEPAEFIAVILLRK
jgi:quercetin dioxygenase-like cupin family protein